ncbi:MULTISPECIES: DUF1616 domain-containing protein [Haloarcula]|nr:MULTISPECIES: DUF1616 domain-containing protein [Haloarcula]
MAAVIISLRRPNAVPTPIRVTLGFLFIFVLPGYTVLTSLFPAIYSQSAMADEQRITHYPISFAEGVVLTVGLSIAIVPLSVLVLNFVAWPIGPVSTVVTVAALTAVMSGIAIIHRIVDSQSAGVPIERLTSILTGSFQSKPTIRSAAEVITVCLLLLSAGIAGAALTQTNGGEQYTELSILTEEAETGNLTADGYPTSLQVGEQTELVVSVGNHEGQTVQYTVVTRLQSVSTSGGERTVTRATTIDTLSVNVGDGDVSRQAMPITANTVADADRHRLVVLLYKGAPPANPTLENAYRDVHIWINITQ